MTYSRAPLRTSRAKILSTETESGAKGTGNGIDTHARDQRPRVGTQQAKRGGRFDTSEELFHLYCVFMWCKMISFLCSPLLRLESSSVSSCCKKAQYVWEALSFNIFVFSENSTNRPFSS
ncbi:hypothetical protein CRENBAI_008991 [Crenichthys baileyi]|uniref:Uncharacterized protein n=1 Tax=Crenichthys baileyi TaxID=28760 RepID=A0AAV9R2E5_9TELE